jgi:hypothetical protein
MAGLFVPLSVNYYDDPKIIDVGPMSELLYVRGLAFVKRAGSDGKISSNQLRSITPRLTSVSRLVERVVDVGLWEANGNGWIVSGWSGWNRPTGEVSEMKSVSGSFGNHRRWHTSPAGTPKVGCPFCMKEGLL